MLKPFLIVGTALVVGGLAYMFTRQGSSFDENATGTIIDPNGARWTHWVDEEGIHNAEPEEAIYGSIYGSQPLFDAVSHNDLIDIIVAYATKHPIPTSIV